eukprot:m.484465 g.484465  ORF g.484465 m.484465 type:complete len:136 (+) comp57202_c0_seq5:130-537(+)
MLAAAGVTKRGESVGGSKEGLLTVLVGGDSAQPTLAGDEGAATTIQVLGPGEQNRMSGNYQPFGMTACRAGKADAAAPTTGDENRVVTGDMAGTEETGVLAVCERGGMWTGEVATCTQPSLQPSALKWKQTEQRD